MREKFNHLYLDIKTARNTKTQAAVVLFRRVVL